MFHFPLPSPLRKWVSVRQKKEMLTPKTQIIITILTWNYSKYVSLDDVLLMKEFLQPTTIFSLKRSLKNILMRLKAVKQLF